MRDAAEGVSSRPLLLRPGPPTTIVPSCKTAMTVDQQEPATSTATEVPSSTSPSSSLRRSGSRSPLVELSSTLSGVRESFASGLKTLQHSKLPKGVELK